MDFSKIENDTLYNLCLRGDNDAWGYVYHYVLAITRWPKWNLRQPPEDMAQDIVVHMVEYAIDKVNNPKAFRGFIKQVACNKIIESFRRKQLPVDSLDSSAWNDDMAPLDPPSPVPSPEDSTINRTVLQILDQAIGQLKENCRNTLPVYIDYQLGVFRNLEAAARELGIKVGTFSARVTRCLDQLRQIPEIRDFFR